MIDFDDFIHFYDDFLGFKLSGNHSFRMESEDYTLLVLNCYLIHSCMNELSAIKEILSSLSDK